MVNECKSVSLTKRTSSGMARHQVEKSYGKWWDILFPLVASRESSDPNIMIEPSFDTINQRVESKTQPNEVTNVSSQNGKANMKKQKEKKLEQEIVNLTRSFIENDPTEKLLNFLTSENERSRRHEAKMMRMMLQIKNPAHFNQAYSTEIFRNVYYQDRESSLFNTNTYAPQFEPSVPQSNKSETSSSRASEYVHVNSQNSVYPTYEPIWTTYQSPDF